MDDVSMMDTTSDDELDFNTPLWKRIKRCQDGITGIMGTSREGKNLFGNPFFDKTQNTLKTSASCGTTEPVAFCERGSPLSEVTGNISRSPPFSGKLMMHKGNSFARSPDCKAKEGFSSGGTTDSRVDSHRTPEKHESPKLPASGKKLFSNSEPVSWNDVSGPLKHSDRKDSKELWSRSSCMFALEKAETSGKQLPTEPRSNVAGSPIKGGWRKLSPTESPKKLFNSPPYLGRHSGQSSPKRSPGGASVYIHWDKNKKMQATSLESRTSSPYSPSKHRVNLSQGSSHSSPSVFGIGSPILIPDTPEVNGKHNVFSGKDRDHTKSKHESFRKRHSDVLLNNLLSEGEHDSNGDLPSGSSGSKHLFSSISPSSRQKDTRLSFVSPPRKFKQYGLQKQEGSSEKNTSKSRDPVWDFADELSSPEKHSPGFLKKFEHERQRDKAVSRVNPDRNKITSPDKDSRRQQCTSTTSEDDDLPLISLLAHKPKSISDSPRGKLNATITSPSRTWLSPTKRKSWGSPSHSIKPGTVVISPWRPQSDGISGISSRVDTWHKDREKGESTSRNSSRSSSREDIEDRIARRRLALARVKKERMKSLLAVFSSDEDDDNGVRPYGDKKRKMEDDAIGVDQIDVVAKRRKASPTNDCLRQEGLKKHERSVHFKHKDKPSILSKVKNSQGMSSYSTDRSPLKIEDASIPTSSSTHTSKRIKDDHPASYGSYSSLATASSTVCENHGRRSAEAPSTKAPASPSSKILHSHASSSESLYSKNSKGKGKKRGKSPTNHSKHTKGHRRSPVESQSSSAPDHLLSSGISGDMLNVVKDDSDDEVVVLDSYSYSASLVGSYGKKRKSHKKTEAKASSTGPSSSGATGSVDDERNTVSPSILQQLNQIDADEAMARRLQEEFDAEMARSVQQHGPPHRSTEDTNSQVDCMASSSVSVRGVDQPDAGTFGNFHPRHNISIEVSSDVPVQIGSFNWNYDFQPASTLLNQPGRLTPPPSPPRLPRRGRRSPRQRGARRRDDRLDEDTPGVVEPTRRERPRDRLERDMEMLWNLHHDLIPGRQRPWMPYPDYEQLIPPPRPGRQQGRGRGRLRGRRRNAIAVPNDGNDYDALLRLADTLGPAVDKRLTQSSIDRLPTFNFTQGQNSGSQEENSCPICMDDYEEGAELRRLPCFHGYHKKCIDMWLKKSQDPVCPICRVEVKIE